MQKKGFNNETIKFALSRFRAFVLLCLFFAISSVAFGARTSIAITAKGYEHQPLTLKTYLDEIAFLEKELAHNAVSNTGHIMFEFDISTTTTCFLELGAYHAIFFAEPGKEYHITLPPFQPLTKAQQFNPFFEPKKILLRTDTTEKNELNTHIAYFEDVFDFFLVKSALNTNIDSIKKSITALQDLFLDSGISFFEDYKQYKYVQLINLNEKHSPSLAITEYFSKLPVSYENLAFWETFNIVFNNFFNAFGNSIEQQYINRALSEDDFTALSAILEYRFNITDQALRELVIIRGLYDAYFFEKRNAPYIFSLMKKWKEHMTIPLHIAILEKIIEQIEENSAKPFNFNLADEKGKYRQLSDFSGKYVYINFCNTNIALSRKDFGILERYADIYKKDLYVVNIFTDDNKERMKNVVSKQKSKQIVNLFGGNNSELINRYNVINIPTYVLIDRNGNFVLSPAPTPDEDFARTFEEILMKEKIKNPEPEIEDKWWEPIK